MIYLYVGGYIVGVILTFLIGMYLIADKMKRDSSSFHKAISDESFSIEGIYAVCFLWPFFALIGIIYIIVLVLSFPFKFIGEFIGKITEDFANCLSNKIKYDPKIEPEEKHVDDW